MDDVVFGVIAILAGGLFCLRGYLAFRLIIPVWAAFVGFATGAGAIAGATGDGFLQTGLAWFTGLALALVFALLAYLFYEVAVVIGMGSIGFALGATLMAALGVDWTWLVVLAGLAAGALLAFVAIVADLPMLLLVVLSALGGASAVTTGIMLLAGTITTDAFDEDTTTAAAADHPWWYAVYVVLAVIGIVAQLRAVDRIRGSMRESWEARRTDAGAAPG